MYEKIPHIILGIWPKSFYPITVNDWTMRERIGFGFFFDQQLSKPRTMLSLVYEWERMFWVLLC
ncbi:hypothetical protein DI44_17985 [Geobacillus sp. CAMR5420]|nr:hypothetical protein DI44_17985 [Geobacillus sp. CAMR5420]